MFLLKVGASFILETEKSDDISFALKIIKGWNPKWDPKHWITDCAFSEISAIENCFRGMCVYFVFAYFPSQDLHYSNDFGLSTFLEANVYICGFHLEQAWDRRITPKETGVPVDKKADVKAMLRQIAFSL